MRCTRQQNPFGIKALTLFGAAVVSLAIAACGSSEDDTLPPDGTSPPPSGMSNDGGGTSNPTNPAVDMGGQSTAEMGTTTPSDTGGGSAIDMNRSNTEDGGTTDTSSSMNGRTGRPTSMSSFYEYGTPGEYSIWLSQEPKGNYCYFIGEVTRICEGRRRTSWADQCQENLPNCLQALPEDSTRGSSDCYTRTRYSILSDDKLPGSCQAATDYFGSDDDGSIQCLFHKHCFSGDNETKRCADYQCICPEGVDCPKDPPGPVQPGD